MNVLLFEDRLEFIELFYLCLELKILDFVKPDSWSMTCKDGVDVGPTSGALFFGFFKILHEEDPSKAHKDLHAMLYVAPLLIRKRLPLSERMDRLIRTLKRIEQKREELTKELYETLLYDIFSSLFTAPILESHVFVPNSVQIVTK